MMAITILCAGCISQQQVAVERSQTANANGALSAGGANGGAARPAAAAPAPSGPKLVNVTVAAGTTMELVKTVSANPDCTSKGLNTVRVTQPPMHGTAKVVQRDGYPTFPSNSPLAVCNKTKLPGVFIDYTPADGFTGTDLMTAEALSLSGLDVEWKILITVK
jgi:hypothetical protein